MSFFLSMVAFLVALAAITWTGSLTLSVVRRDDRIFFLGLLLGCFPLWLAYLQFVLLFWTIE